MADPIGGGFCFPPDRTVCGPPPLEANLFAFCKGSLIYKRYVWVLPIPYPLLPPFLLIAYSLFNIPFFSQCPIHYSLCPSHFGSRSVNEVELPSVDMTSKTMFPGKAKQPMVSPPQHLLGPYDKDKDKGETKNEQGKAMQPKVPPPRHLLLGPYDKGKGKADEGKGETKNVQGKADEGKGKGETKHQQGAGEGGSDDIWYDLKPVCNEQLHEELAVRLGLRSKQEAESAAAATLAAGTTEAVLRLLNPAEPMAAPAMRSGIIGGLLSGELLSGNLRRSKQVADESWPES